MKTPNNRVKLIESQSNILKEELDKEMYSQRYFSIHL